ncbi:hypothetical protein ASPNIDRAFT_36453, partial [Aspergillus niger ATCC 1015]
MSFTHGDYTVAWICALPLELAAAKAMLDDVHPPLPQPESDHNVYTLGRIGSHNVVVACLPGGVYGTISATGVVSHMVSTFPTLRSGFGLMTQLVERPERESDNPYIHYGLIASGDQVMKDAKSRDSIARDLDILCFEMEAAGLMDELPSLAIRGICDYFPTYCRKKSREIEQSVWMIPFRRNPRYESVEQAYMNIASKLRMTDIKPAEVKEKVKAYLSLENDMGMWSTNDTTDTVLTDFLPESEQGHILFTTRSRKVAVKLASSHVITLAFLPLAITQAAAYINENSIGLSDYLQLLRDQEPHVIELLSEEFGDEMRYKDIQNPALLPQPTSNKDKTDALGLLKAFSFISEGSGDSSLNLHRLVHLATRNWLRENQHDGRWKEAEELEVQVLELRKQVLGPEHPDTLASMSDLAWTYGNQGRWKEAEELQVQVLELRKQVLGPEHPGTLTSMSDLAMTYRNQGRWKEAEELEVQVLELRKQVLGPEHSGTLISMSTLAWTYRNQGRWKEAEELQVQVLELRKQVLGPEHPGTLISMSDLAWTYRDQGRWKEAEELQVQVLELRKQVLGPEHPGTLTSMSTLAWTYRDQGRWKEAEELEVQVLELRKQVLGPEHPDTLASMSDLAWTYGNQGRWKEAEELQVQVLELRKQVLGPEHPGTLTSMSNLAWTYWNQGRWKEAEENQGRWKEAEELQVQVLELRKQVLGPEHPGTLTSMSILAWTYWNQGRWKEAEELQVQVLETSKQVLGPEHPDTLTSMSNLAFTWNGRGK